MVRKNMKVKNENDDIKKELKMIVGILLNQSKIQQWSLGDKVRYLTSMGYQDNQEIANMLDTTYNMVAKEKSKAKKGKKNE